MSVAPRTGVPDDGARRPASTGEEWWLKDDSDDADEGALRGDEPEFYDPNLDDEDEAWMHKQRKGRQSDAILSCPSCLTTLCIDCQQHAEKDNHFRAMFTMNCRTNWDKTVEAWPIAATRGKRQRDGARQSPSVEGQAKRFFPVCCDECDTHVGVQDDEEVYHFYHVVASNA